MWATRTPVSYHPQQHSYTVVLNFDYDGHMKKLPSGKMKKKKTLQGTTTLPFTLPEKILTQFCVYRLKRAVPVRRTAAPLPNLATSETRALVTYTQHSILLGRNAVNSFSTFTPELGFVANMSASWMTSSPIASWCDLLISLIILAVTSDYPRIPRKKTRFFSASPHT